jgi:DNA replication protein DnaC
MAIPKTPTNLRERALALHLNGLVAHWDEVAELDWVTQLVEWEEAERARRSMLRRLGTAAIGKFKPLADFDWAWPTHCDRAAVEELMRLDFLEDASNVVLMGPNGVGKTMIAQNLAHQALVRGHTVRFAAAGDLLGELAAIDSASRLQRRLRHYAHFDLLCIDEVGYLSYSNRHADLLFELTNRRYEKKSTILTSNRAFSEWGEVFPNAACVVSMVDRLTHHAEIIPIEGESYRVREAQLRNEQRSHKRRQKKP